MLREMNDGYMWWLILVGLAIGVVMSWLLIVRLPRGESDVSSDERQEEAVWISDTIERHGGVAPLSLVDEVLELHQSYLRSPGLVDQIAEMPATSPMTVPALPPRGQALPPQGQGSRPPPPPPPPPATRGGPPPPR